MSFEETAAWRRIEEVNRLVVGDPVPHDWPFGIIKAITTALLELKENMEDAEA